MKQTLQLKLGQSLTMTPQLQQAIRLLQLSTLELQTEIQEILESNPLLEVSDDTGAETDSTAEAAQPGDDAGENGATMEFTSPDALAGKADNSAESGASNDDADREIDAEMDIPNDLPIDSSWEDTYESGASAGTRSNETDNRSLEQSSNAG